MSHHLSGSPIGNLTISQQEQALLNNKNTINQIAKDMLLLNKVNISSSMDNQSMQESNSNYRQPSRSNGQHQVEVGLSGASYGHPSLRNQFMYDNETVITRLDDIESAILRSTVPIDLNETDVITVNGERGIWANKNEIVNWKGHLPISQYAINDDPNPEIIRKRTEQQLVYHQEVAIRYLRPPTPPAPGEILIQQEGNSLIPPAPPLVIRQQPARPTTPPPLVVREAPPQPPPAVGRKVITISGKKIPPPPRKVIIERLPQLPCKPQSIIIERWLPYKQIKRKVIYAKSNENNDSLVVKPKNIIVQWEPPKVEIKKEFKDLGIVRANPVEYVQRYGSSLKRSIELPTFVKEIKPPAGVILAADTGSSTIYELEGDIYALNLVDLEREGLVEYRYLLKQIESPSNSNISFAISNNNLSTSYASPPYIKNDSNINLNLLNELYKSIDVDSNNTIAMYDAEKLLTRLNSRLGKTISNEEEAKAFVDLADKNIDGRVDFDEFKYLFESQLKN